MLMTKTSNSCGSLTWWTWTVHLLLFNSRLRCLESPACHSCLVLPPEAEYFARHFCNLILTMWLLAVKQRQLIWSLKVHIWEVPQLYNLCSWTSNSAQHRTTAELKAAEMDITQSKQLACGRTQSIYHVTPLLPILKSASTIFDPLWFITPVTRDATLYCFETVSVYRDCIMIYNISWLFNGLQLNNYTCG